MTIEIPQANIFLLRDARVPGGLAGKGSGSEARADGSFACDILIRDGLIASVSPPDAAPKEVLAVVDLKGGLVLPRFVDAHTHLDKGHILHRAINPDGTFLGARNTVMADRAAKWTAQDVAKRMDFALRAAFAHGTQAIRTHIDSLGPQTAISWPVFAEMREAWKGRIELQAAALCPTELAVDDEAQFRTIVETAARQGGSIGGLTYMGEKPGEKLERALDRVIQAAAANGLGLDFHVDESSDEGARTLEPIARAVIRNKFSGPVVAGHCCSLALMADQDRARVIRLVAEAGITVVSLPMVNMYLQDRAAGRTPRWRGVTAFHELKAAGAEVLVASDNTRDPFFAYGDLDMIEVFREATRVLHLDHGHRDGSELLAVAPARALGFAARGLVEVGAPADLVLVGARNLWELNARPWSDRVVLVSGQPIARELPDYRELDELR